jgi:hypothetical protein
MAAMSASFGPRDLTYLLPPTSYLLCTTLYLPLPRVLDKVAVIMQTRAPFTKGLTSVTPHFLVGGTPPKWLSSHTY